MMGVREVAAKKGEFLCSERTFVLTIAWTESSHRGHKNIQTYTRMHTHDTGTRHSLMGTFITYHTCPHMHTHSFSRGRASLIIWVGGRRQKYEGALGGHGLHEPREHPSLAG